MEKNFLLNRTFISKIYTNKGMVFKVYLSEYELSGETLYIALMKGVTYNNEYGIHTTLRHEKLFSGYSLGYVYTEVQAYIDFKLRVFRIEEYFSKKGMVILDLIRREDSEEKIVIKKPCLN